MQDGQHRAIVARIEKLVGVPRRRQRPGLRLAVADHAGDDELGIVERGAEGVAERIAELATLVDRAGTFRRRVAGDAAGKRELQEQLLQAGFILADVRIDLAVTAFEIGVGDHRGAAVAWAGNEDHVEVVFDDDPIEMRVDEVLTGRGAPVSEQHALHVRRAPAAA